MICIGDHCCCLAIVAEPVFAILAAFSNCMLCKHQNNTHHSLSTWGPRLCNESLLYASFACSKANPFTALASHFASNQSHSPLTLIGKGRVYGKKRPLFGRPSSDVPTQARWGVGVTGKQDAIASCFLSTSIRQLRSYSPSANTEESPKRSTGRETARNQGHLRYRLGMNPGRNSYTTSSRALIAHLAIYKLSRATLKISRATSNCTRRGRYERGLGAQTLHEQGARASTTKLLVSGK